MLDDKFNMIATVDESAINRKNSISSKRRTNSAGLAKLLEALLDVGHDVCVRRATRGGKCGGVEVRELDFAWISVWIASSHALFKHREEKALRLLPTEKWSPCATYRGFRGLWRQRELYFLVAVGFRLL